MYETVKREQADLDWLARYERETRELAPSTTGAGTEYWDDLDEASEEMAVESSNHYSDRVEASRQFCSDVFHTRDAPAPCCLPEREQQARRDFATAAWPGAYEAKREETGWVRPSLDLSQIATLSRTKDEFYVKSETNSVILPFEFANFVTVTYLGHALTGSDYAFNLHALSQQLLPYYGEYRKKKFAKVNLRLREGGSHMIYGSGIIVESGSSCTRISKQMLRHTIWVLRHHCGYKHLIVQRRACFNIVATGNVCRPNPEDPDGPYINQSLCLGVLKHQFPAASYKKDKFSGVIIKLVDVERHFADQAYHEGVNMGRSEYVYDARYDSDDDDRETIAQINAECDDGAVKREDSQPAEAESRRNDTLEEEFAQLADKKENGTFLIFKEGQIICTGCKSKRRLMEAYDKIYALLVRCVENEDNLAEERRLAPTGQKG